MKKYFKIPLLLLLGLVYPLCIWSQTALTLEDAMKIVRQNNHQIKAGQLEINYQEFMANTGFDLQPTNIGVELGQINSAYFDTKFGVGQSFQLPKVYQRKKTLLNEQKKKANIELQLSVWEVEKKLEQVFSEYYYLIEKEKLLLKSDSLFATHLEKTWNRLDLGETDVLESSTSEWQLGNIRLQLDMVRQDIQVVILQLNYLLNGSEVFTPASEKYKVLAYNILVDSSTLLQHPMIRSAYQDIATTKANIMVQKSNLLPDFSIGYSNVSIRGVGADNNLYNANNRFSSVQLGISLPIYTKAIKASISALQVKESIAALNVTSNLTKLNNEIKVEYNLYNQALQKCTYFETKGLKNAKMIQDVAQNQLANGQISYLEFVMLTNQALDARNQYIDAIKMANDHIINLYYLTNKF